MDAFAFFAHVIGIAMIAIGVIFAVSNWEPMWLVMSIAGCAIEGVSR